MITINDVTYEEDDLTAAELDVLINAYATAVKNSVAPEEEVAEH